MTKIKALLTRRKILKTAARTLAMAVVFATTYALVLPAITQTTALQASMDDIQVRVEAIDDEALPANTSMVLTPVTLPWEAEDMDPDGEQETRLLSQEELDAILEAALEDNEDCDAQLLSVMDISLYHGGREIEPDGRVSLTFKSDIISQAINPVIVHLLDDGTVERLQPSSDDTDEDETSGVLVGMGSFFEELEQIINPEGSETPVEGETETPVEGENETPVEGETETPVEGEVETPVEGETETPVEGEVETPVEGEIEAPVETEVEAPVEEQPIEDTGLEGTDNVTVNTDTQEVPESQEEPSDQIQVETDGFSVYAIVDVQPVETLLSEVVVPEDYIEYTAEADGITVTAYAAPDAFQGEDVRLAVELIAQGTDEYDKAQADLDARAEAEEDFSFDGFVPLDIRFIVDGEEQEPASPVMMRFDAKEFLPADVDPETVQVQHHVEDTETGETSAVETVAQYGDETVGTVEVTGGSEPSTCLALDQVQPVTEDQLIFDEEAGEYIVEAASEDETPADLTVEFSVETFSTYTITWGGSHKLALHFIENLSNPGKPIGGAQTKNVASGATVTLNKNTVPTIEGYTFDHIRFTSSTNTDWKHRSVVKIKYADGAWQWQGLNYDSNGKEIAGSWTSWSSSSINRVSDTLPNSPSNSDYYKYGSGQCSIYIVYRRNADPVETPAVAVDPTSVFGQKTVDLIGDNQYKLNLSVSGNVGTETSKAKVDVMFIVDMSGSMHYGVNLNNRASDPADYRITHVRKVMTDLIKKLNNRDDIIPRYSLVEFSNGYTSSVNKVYDWEYYGQRILGDLYETAEIGATNYESAFYKAKNLITTAREGAKTIVIFLTDGEPTCYGGFTGSNYSTSVAGWNTNYFDANALFYGTKMASGLSCSRFYAVGFGLGFNSGNGVVIDSTTREITGFASGADIPTTYNQTISGNYGPYGLLSITKGNTLSRVSYSSGTWGSKISGTQTKFSGVNAQERKAYAAPSAATLSSLFDTIYEDIVYNPFTNVKVHDTLSEYVDYVNDLQITIKDDSGKTYTSSGTTESVNSSGQTVLKATLSCDDAKFIAKYNTVTKKLTMYTDPAEYQLRQNWFYNVSMTIEPTEEAYNKYNITDGFSYKDAAESGTGTYGGDVGIYSNAEGSAYIESTYKGVKKDNVPYLHPVVRVDTKPLVIEKYFDGLTEAEAATLKGKLVFEVDGNSFTLASQSYTEIKENGQVVGWRFTIPAVAYGDHKVTEITTDGRADISQLVRFTSCGTERSKVAAGEEVIVPVNASTSQAKAVFVNSYLPDVMELTLKKSVLGGSASQMFGFRLTVDTGAKVTWSDGADVTKTTVEGKDIYTFQLCHDQTITCTLPSSLATNGAVTVEEYDHDGYISVWRNAVRSDGQIVVEGEELYTPGGVLSVSLNNQRQEVLYICQNTAGSALPSTGGPGTAMFRILGTALMVGAAGAYIITDIRRKAHN